MFYTKTCGNKPGKFHDTTHKTYVEDNLKYSLGWTLTGFYIPFPLSFSAAKIPLTRSGTCTDRPQRGLEHLPVWPLREKVSLYWGVFFKINKYIPVNPATSRVTQ